MQIGAFSLPTLITTHPTSIYLSHFILYTTWNKSLTLDSQFHFPLFIRIIITISGRSCGTVNVIWSYNEGRMIFWNFMRIKAEKIRREAEELRIYQARNHFSGCSSEGWKIDKAAPCFTGTKILVPIGKKRCPISGDICEFTLHLSCWKKPAVLKYSL